MGYVTRYVVCPCSPLHERIDTFVFAQRCPTGLKGLLVSVMGARLDVGIIDELEHTVVDPSHRSETRNYNVRGVLRLGSKDKSGPAHVSSSRPGCCACILSLRAQLLPLFSHRNTTEGYGHFSAPPERQAPTRLAGKEDGHQWLSTQHDAVQQLVSLLCCCRMKRARGGVSRFIILLLRRPCLRPYTRTQPMVTTATDESATTTAVLYKQTHGQCICIGFC